MSRIAEVTFLERPEIGSGRSTGFGSACLMLWPISDGLIFSPSLNGIIIVADLSLYTQ